MWKLCLEKGNLQDILCGLRWLVTTKHIGQFVDMNLLTKSSLVLACYII